MSEKGNPQISRRQLFGLAGMALGSAGLATLSKSASAQTTDVSEHVLSFDNTAEMRASTALKAGDTVFTKGYYQAGDGGHAYYLIRQGSQQNEDKGKYHNCTNNKFAELQLNGVANILCFGAKGDNQEESALANRHAILAAASALPESGGTILIPSVGTAKYRIDANWPNHGGVTIRRSNITLIVENGALLHSLHNGTGADGHVIGFAGEAHAPIENCHICGGGAIASNTSSGVGAENAIGFTNVVNFSCIGMTVPHSVFKGITAQGNVHNGIISGNRIGQTRFDAIAIETDTHFDNDYFVIENNTIEHAGVGYTEQSPAVAGIKFTAASSLKSFNVITQNNRVKKSLHYGYSYNLCDTIKNHSDICDEAGLDGFEWRSCNDINAHVTSKNSGRDGIKLDSCGSQINVECNISWPSRYAINILRPRSLHVLKPFISGNKHQYRLSTTSDQTINTPSIHIIHPQFADNAWGNNGGYWTGDIMPHVDFGNRVSRLILPESTAPDVTASTLYTVNNERGVLVSNLTGANAPDKEVELFFVNTNTTLEHANGNLRLKGHSNVTPPVGGSIKLRFINNLWHETYRSF
ncbi:hypothetical protein CWC22_015505 [Pseudoalteromonas rubra]|uniref:Right handed beta helix domain-containing protein n=1 Tax=Pseudoalteromonas rubra TaxID=43658 RepID=A0A7S7YVD7_9GAMM|nr:hypothetical protein [Pseudoalteromonas rubra]QPB84314.1 hypothetical protein CWC22_015505 [Pseudoalteromonas rubra]